MKAKLAKLHAKTSGRHPIGQKNRMGIFTHATVTKARRAETDSGDAL
jgi:hypothetical protein